MDKELLRRLKSKFEEFKIVEFPYPGLDEEAGGFHADLVEYDGHIAGYITRIINGDRINPKLIEYDEELWNKLENMIKVKGNREDLINFRNYMSKIEELRTIAIDVVNS
jgi:hypothetical protein